MSEFPTGPATRPWARPITSGPARIAVVGMGQFAQDCVLPAISKADHAECTVLVSGSPSDHEYRPQRVINYESFRSGDATDAYDAVYVTSPNHTHLEHVQAAARHGKDVLCEKPMAASVKQAYEMRQCCVDADVKLMIANRVQFKPTIRYVRGLIRDDVLGTPIHVHGGTSFKVLSRGGPEQWRLDPNAGGGALRDIGIYPLNTIRFLLDTEVTPRTASREMTTQVDDVDAHVEFQLDLSAGGTAACTASFAAHPASHLRLIGTEGVVHVEAAFRPFVEPVVTIHQGTQHWTVDAERANEYHEQVAYFAQCVLRDEQPEPDGDEGVSDMEAIEAIEHLAREQE